MRVAMVLPNLDGGGAQRVFLDIAAGLTALGVAVDIVAVRAEGPLGASLPALATLHDLNAARVSLSLRPLLRYLRRQRPDVILSCLNHTNLLSIAAGRLTSPRTPVVATHHNHLSTAARHKSARRDRAMPVILRVGLPWADRVVAVSDGVADNLATTTGLARNRIEVIYNPVRFDRIHQAGQETATHPWLIDKTGPVVLAVGRLIEQKDFETLIRAVARMPGCRLIILGEGDRRPILEGLVAELQLGDRVDLPGFAANPFPFFQRADAFALSSLWEGLPTVLIEALRFDLPIVATDCRSGPQEILEGGRWGRLVPMGDVTAMADALRAALQESGRPLRPEARDAQAWSRYDPDTVSRRYLALLESARGGSAGRGGSASRPRRS